MTSWMSLFAGDNNAWRALCHLKVPCIRVQSWTGPTRVVVKRQCCWSECGRWWRGEVRVPVCCKWALLCIISCFIVRVCVPALWRPAKDNYEGNTDTWRKRIMSKEVREADALSTRRKSLECCRACWLICLALFLRHNPYKSCFIALRIVSLHSWHEI